MQYATGWFGDKYRQRGICLCFNETFSILGLAVLTIDAQSANRRVERGEIFIEGGDADFRYTY